MSKIRTSITIDENIKQLAKQRCEQLDINFSNYIEELLLQSMNMTKLDVKKLAQQK